MSKISDLTPYGTGNGLKIWTLDPNIEALELDQLEKVVERAQTALLVYGGFDGSKDNFVILVTDMVYYAAEVMYYRGISVRSRTSPFRAERIGSYSYDKGAQTQTRDIFDGSVEVQDMLMRLRDHSSNPVSYGTRIVHTLPANPDTGVIDMVDSYNNRTQRAIERAGLVSDTEDFNYYVYGDRELYVR